MPSGMVSAATCPPSSCWKWKKGRPLARLGHQLVRRRDVCQRAVPAGGPPGLLARAAGSGRKPSPDAALSIRSPSQPGSARSTNALAIDCPPGRVGAGPVGRGGPVFRLRDPDTGPGSRGTASAMAYARLQRGTGTPSPCDTCRLTAEWVNDTAYWPMTSVPASSTRLRPSPNSRVRRAWYGGGHYDNPLEDIRTRARGCLAAAERNESPADWPDRAPRRCSAEPQQRSPARPFTSTSAKNDHARRGRRGRRRRRRDR